LERIIFMAPSLFLCCERSFWQPDDEAGGEVGDADGGVGGVDVLAALAAGAVGVDAQVFGLDVDDDGVVDLGRDEDAGEAGVAALGGVEGRDADEAMDAGFAGDKTEGEVAGDGEGGGLDAGLVAVLDLVDLDFEVLALAPADVHAHEHLGPVLDSVPPAPGWTVTMALSGSVSPESMVLDSSFSAKSTEGGDLALEVGLGVFAFAGEFEVGFDVVGAAGEFGVVGEQSFEALALAHEGLRRARRRPRRWGRRSFLR
jgi:hypothetical protein